MRNSDFVELSARAPRTSRDICRDACAIETPQHRPSIGHRAAVIASLIGLIFVIGNLLIERLS